MYRDRISNRFERLNNFIIILILFTDGGFDNIIYLFLRFISRFKFASHCSVILVIPNSNSSLQCKCIHN